MKKYHFNCILKILHLWYITVEVFIEGLFDRDINIYMYQRDIFLEYMNKSHAS